MSKKTQRLKPSEILTAFATAKAHAAKHATSQILELVNAEDHTTRVSSTVPLHQPLFESTPTEVWIDEYTPFEPLTLKLRFRNCDTVVRRLKIEPPRSPVFRVRPWDAANKGAKRDRMDGRVAAGMEIAFALEFFPQEVADYSIDLVCCTERERFLLPVRVRGRFAALDLPDELEIGICPVKMPTTRVLTIRNVGTRGSSFAFQTSKHFRVTPPSATLVQGASMQIELSLFPPNLESSDGELEVKDDSGQIAVVKLAGRVVNVDAFVSQPIVEPSATYLALSSRKMIKICNESEFALNFSWKSFADSTQEEVERTNLLGELSRMEAAEYEYLQLQLQEAEEVESGFTESPFDVRKTLETKYRHLRKATLDDSMQFVDACFSITPLSGRVWAHSEVDVVVCFTPEVANLYSCCAYLEIAGQAARLPLQLRGQGIGPKAKVVYNEFLDFGDVFINDERTRDFTIQNKGEIPVEFELIPLTVPPGISLTVHPSHGTLAVNAMLKIEVTFCSQELGEAVHHIRFSMQGSVEELTVRFKAQVIPPVFHFDADQVEFGAVSYSFLQTRTVKLVNASKIAMKYSLRVPEEASYKQKELELVPSQGKLDAYGEQEITIHFTSHNVKVYQYQLVVGVTGVGTDLLSIPIRAQCFVPELTILQHELNFGRCFLRYPHKQTVVVENKSTHLFGRFEVGEQDDHSRAIATYSASDISGSVGPGERVSVDISLSCEKPGSIRLPMVVTIPGSTDIPLSVTLSATGSGPKVELDQGEINWGNCSCLVDHKRILRMTNVSLIPAGYKTFIRNARSKFQIDQKEGVLMAGESLEFVLMANLDDTAVFKDQLHILITEGDNLVVPLSIKGTGTTMWSPSELRVIDFSHQMTSKECEWSCTLENKGRRVQVLTWVNKTAAVANSKTSSTDEGDSSKKISKGGLDNRSTVQLSKLGSNKRSQIKITNEGRNDVIPVFSVFPGTIELKPRTACVFVFKGLSSNSGLIQENLVCETRVGKEKVSKLAFMTAIRAIFVDPKLTPSSPLLSFEYIHHPGNQIAMQSQPLSLTNACELPLSFTLRTQTPFALDCWEAELQPGEKMELNVEFYPGFKDDYTCRVINGKVLITYTGHPQKDSVELLGDISFPNLSFETTKIDFGCTLNDTQKSIIMNITNTSKVDTIFRWVFIEDDKEASSTATTKKLFIPINQVFDVLPIRGLLKPNESEKVEFVYYGHANRKFKSTVACEVEGGPEYELTLSGEASSLVYKLDKQSLDFGQVLYNKTEDRDFSIVNIGKVPFSFNISVENIATGRTLEISPISGKIGPNEKQRILVRLRPGIPEFFEETVVLEIAHFQPIPFKLFGSGTFAAVTLNLPRENHPTNVVRGEAPKWKELKRNAKQNIELAMLEESNNQIINCNVTLGASHSKSTISNTHRGNEKVSSITSMPALTQVKTVNQRVGAPGSPVRCSAATTVDDLDVEIEACRLFFADYLLGQELKKADTRALKSSEMSNDNPAEDTESAKSANIASMAARSPSSTSNSKVQKKRETEGFPFILSQFALDFGNVVLGTHKIKRFSVTNIGHGPASFQLDKNLASSRGFQLEPERVVRLPEKQSVEFTVTFHARKNIEMGLHMAQLPIVIKNGPPCIALVRALVTVPDISISSESLDFGKRAVSTCHTMFTQLQNVSVVPAEWAIKKPMGSTKDVGNFRFTPKSGLLTPGAKVNIQIEFIPDGGRQFMIKLPIKINSNPKTRSIVCRGEGSELRISFYPPLVELGPVLPCAPPEEHLVEIRNDSDYLVEVFSLDFDSSYQQEEALLRSLPTFVSEDILQLPVRVLGQSIVEYLAENGLVTMNALNETKVRGDTGESNELNSPSETSPPENVDILSSWHSEPLTAEFNPAPRKGIDYIMVGPPRCGKSTQAYLLAEKESLNVWTIDGAIKLICAAKGPLAIVTRKALGMDTSESDIVSTLDEGLSMNSNIAPQETPESDYTHEVTSPESISEKLTHIMDQIVLWRLTQPDVKNGSVLDGFENSFLSFEETLKCCAKAFIAARIIILGFDEESYESMSALLANQTSKPMNNSSVTSSPLRDRLKPNKPVNIGNNNVDGASGGDQYRSAEDEEIRQSDFEAERSLETELQALSSSSSGHVSYSSTSDLANSEGTLLRPKSKYLADDNIALQDKVVELGRLVSVHVSKPTTFEQYAQSLEAMKHQLALFMIRGDDEVEASSQTLQVISDSKKDDYVWTLVKDRTTPNNFILDIPIIDASPPLLIHGVIFSTIEKFARELESSYLPIPASAEFQLLRRPPERFPRKRVARFSLRSPAILSSRPSEAISLHSSGSHSQVPSKNSSRPQTAGKTSSQTDAEGNQNSTNNIESQDTSEVSNTEPQSSIMRASSSVSRWIIAPHSRVNVLIQFASADIGNFDCTLGFEIVGVRREFTLFGRGTSSVPTINSDPRNVFMHRVKSRPESSFVQKKFVLSRNQFEFGPLIIANKPMKAPETEREIVEWQKTSPNNVEVFRMSNTSKFPIHVEFGVEKQDDNTFAVFPPAVDIKEGDTREVKVWANPLENGLHENTLICCISDNPEPVEFHISCYGCTPELKLRGPWEQLVAASTSEREDQRHAPDLEETTSNAPVSSRSSLPGSAPATSRSNAPPIDQPLAQSDLSPQPVLDFEQLLLKREDKKTFYIENVSPVAVSWSLLSEGLPADFRILPIEGTINPLQKTPVTVVFSAITEAVYEFKLQIEFSDAERALHVSDHTRIIELILRGEAYKIDVSSFDHEVGEVPSQIPRAGPSSAVRTAGGAGRLDFGLVRVGEKHSRSFNIRNHGKYSIKYFIAIRSIVTREYFLIDPSEMVLEAGQTSSVNVTFTSKNEVTLRDCRDIKCTIIEMLSGEAVREFYVYTSARSVFSKFRLQPNRGINFGPHKYNDQTQTKRIEIRNDGEFPFKFYVQTSKPATAREKKEPFTTDTPISPSTLNLGQFAISPDCGYVDPGITMGLDVAFQPKDCAVYSETLRIQISGRNVDDSAESNMLLYELAGESCYPGINTTDYENIFEEQTVLRSGVELGMPIAALRNRSFQGSFQPITFAEKEKIFSFGPLIAAANWKGTMERFKISNPMKVSSTVQFSVASSLGTTESEDSSQAFTVQPAVWEIPPHEHRFVSVYFRPTTIALFQTTFRAKVEDSPPQSSVTDSLLEFELRGEGTMPCITVTEPTVRDSTGALVLDYGRVRTSKAKDMHLSLRNDGILPATVLFSIQANPNFLFALGNGSVVVSPKATERLTLQFRPQKIHDEPTTSQLKITVQNNPFEETTFKLLGTGYREDLAFEDLPRGYDDELHFDDIRVPNTNNEVLSLREVHILKDTKVFSLCNQSSDVVRFEWPMADPFHFSPRTGHLRPKEHKLIRATFEPALDNNIIKAIIYEAHHIIMQIQRISYRSGSANEREGSGWDDSIQTISFDQQKGERSGSKKTLVEPEYEAIGSLSTISLSCFAAADVLAFECDTTSISFRKTFMFQVCTHKIVLRNKSKIRLMYSCRWEQGLLDQSDVGGYPLPVGGVVDNCPFEVTPENGVISGEETQVFTVKFAPMEVDEYCYRLCFDIPDTLGDSITIKKVDVRGSSLRPACHFDVERSDYAQWRAPNLAGPHGELGPLDPSVRVIEMESLGVRVRNTRRFYVVNPTNVSYEFSWTPQGEINPCFRCATPKGLMLAGKRCEMIFEFTPQQLELQEMFWYFKIPHFQVNQSFLFVGTTTEPRVALDRGSVNFNTLLIGTKTSQIVALVNQEHIPFNFVFDKTSLDFAGEVPALIVHPLSGVIPPNSRTSIEIEFIPTEEKSYSFNLNCIVKRKPTRLSLNVKGEGYSIHDALILASDDQNENRALLPGPGNVVDFGIVRVNDESHRSIVLHNSGKFNFDFNWTIAKPFAAFMIEPMHGTIKKNDKATCRLVFGPTKQSSLDGMHATCTVASSRNYVLTLRGNAVPPMLQFSFTSHDFGPCFIAESDSNPMMETVLLTVFNLDPESGIDLDCLFEKKPHLRVDCPPSVLGPRESVDIPIVFTARSEIAYLEMIPFTINGSSTVNVSIRGEGVFPKVELVNSSMQMIVLGNLQIGHQISRTVKIANRSKRKTMVEFVDLPQPGVASLDALSISIFPQDEVLLRAKENADIEFRFSPTQRISSFQKDIFIRVDGSTKKLLTLSGCCQGIEVVLETDTLSYGSVCLGSQLVRKIRLQNRGDVATKFQWKTREFSPDFLVSPVEGMVAPNQHKTIDVTFKPAAVNPDVRYDRVTCMIDGTAPITLTLVGSCVSQATSSIQDINFDSPVRQENHKMIVIENTTEFAWNLFPVVQGDHWSCPENVLVPAHGKTNLDVTYYPLTMTKQNCQEKIDLQRPIIHTGSVFLAIPDGSALLYNFFGKAAVPVPPAVISMSIAAKKTLTISIPIKNWLKVPQTFAVDIQKPPGNMTVVVQGPSSILLPAAMTRNYNMKFFCYTEGTASLSVRLVNQENGEYLVQDVSVTVSKTADMETLYFDAPVRQSIKKTVVIENPFEDQRQINFMNPIQWWNCSSPNIRVRQLNEISGKSEGSYEIEYRPTLHSETPVEDRLTISFVELGEYTYNLVLSTQAVGPERILYFNAPLGGSQTQAFTFTSYAGSASEFACTVQDSTSFSVPKIFKVEGSSLWEGKSESILVKFEPEAIGDFRDTLTLYSDSIGVYKCTLEGLSVPPLPQGPYVFSTTKDIEFKNVFSTQREFEIMVDNPRFVVMATSLSIPSKLSTVITVKVDPTQGEKSAQDSTNKTGKLLVSCPQLKDLPPWVYYLESTA